MRNTQLSSTSLSPSLYFWLRTQSISTKFSNQWRVELRKRFQSTIARYELLAVLEDEDKGLCMGDIAQRLMVSNGNVTIVTKQLAKTGLIIRKNNPEDYRSSILSLSDEGQKLIKEMNRALHELIEKTIGKLDIQSLKAVNEKLDELDYHLSTSE
ncbi:MarR family winged helix-turn-helix transcriptional regulator [Basilea psittacipulmonis]|uniref:MarR family winged helix-turn-helix transcriptional regulator n=1 Tax=Basilea psittacipulmonis TaxID=1472345 RepID=UPI000689E193|nr:MarR family transcriptional regulator [Basilea psittacipulmonis]